MAKLSYSARAFADLERLVPALGSRVLTDFLNESDPSVAEETVGLIEEAVELLMRHPLIGRPVEHPLRELAISRGRTGYVALYSFEENHDAVLILAIRHQREVGYSGQDED